MIVIGYQGIGKSSLSKIFSIDLESGNFWVDGRRDENWYIPYCNIANDISSQGYIVCTSSHKPVRDYLKNSKERVVVVFPALELKEQWVERLKKRYEESGLEKDYKAMMNAVDRYDDNIKELMAEPFDKLIIKNMNYNLTDMILDYDRRTK